MASSTSWKWMCCPPFVMEEKEKEKEKTTPLGVRVN